MRWLPDPRVAPHAQAIEQRVGQFASHLRAANLADSLDPLMLRMIKDGFRDTGAHEGVIWMLDLEQKNLLCAWQMGADSSRLANFRHALDNGVSSMVLATQQAFCENNLAQNRAAASVLEERMKVIICARIMVPWSIAGRQRGLIACYQTKPNLEAPDPAGFDEDAVEEISLMSRLLGRLLDHKLLCAAIGLDEDMS